jgi:ribosomal protein S18 acetylase RimI-like enzyme
MNANDDDPLYNGFHSKNDSMGITVRQMEIDDIPLVFHLGESLFTAQDVPILHRTWDEYEVVNLFQTDGEYCFVAEGSYSEIIGFALGTVIEKSHSWTYGYLLWLGIHPKHQQAGLAKRLFSHFRNAMMEAGARIIMVDTQADNEPALRFFRKMGFNNVQEHVFLTMNVDDERRRLEERRQARQARHIIEKHQRSKTLNG